MYKHSIALLLTFTILYSSAQNISLEDIWLTGKYRAEYPPYLNWTKDGQSYTYMKKDDKGVPSVALISAKNGSMTELTALMSPNLPDSIDIEDHILSPDQTKILFITNEEPIYRRSSKAYYYLFETSSGSFVPLHDFSKGKISYPEFSPDGNKIAFVRSNNLYITDLATKKESVITTDGKFNSIINGTCDWVYEEEFEFAKAFFWSPDNQKIAYYRFDESKVKEYHLQLWGNNYPTDYRYKYPKVGEENSLVKLCCYFLKENKTVDIDASVPGEREYFPRMRWTGDANVLSYYRMNRLQNNLEIVHYNVSNKKSFTPYQEKDSAYVEINDNHFYFSNSENFIFTSEKNGFRHIYLYNKSSKKLSLLTNGAFEVSEVLGIDERAKLVYFISHEDSPTQKHLYSVSLNGLKRKKISLEKGVHTISFAPEFNYYFDTYSDANTPFTMRLHEASTGTILKTIMGNKELREQLAHTSVSPCEFLSFKTSQNIPLNAWMIKPSYFDATKKYPVFITIYGGPGAQEVIDAWKGASYLWYQLLAQKGYIVFCVDGRGTGGRGAPFKKITQFNLGKYETEDLIETARYLNAQQYVDSTRIGIFGWSFGGYLSSLAITKGADHFKTAIAVAPVTNWKYYDNIYTERYMGLLKDNLKGYDENAPAYFAKLLKGNYLLIHGTADDNVHIQNAFEMQKALIDANKQFEVFYYPDRNHRIAGGNTRYHLYKMMTEFILKKL